MSLSAEQMRKELEAWYSAPSWKYKVSKMSDKQVAAVLTRLQSAREYRKKHQRRFHYTIMYASSRG